MTYQVNDNFPTRKSNGIAYDTDFNDVTDSWEPWVDLETNPELGGSIRWISIDNDLDKNVLISFDAGNTVHLVVLAGTTKTIDLGSLGLHVETDIYVKCTVAPTSGSFCLSVLG